MVRRLALPLVVLVVLVGLVVYIRRTAGDFPPPPGQGDRAAAPKPAGPPRALSDRQREAMLVALAAEAGPVKKIWFQVERSKPEHLAYQKAIEQVFRDAGWDVTALDSDGMSFKPGIYLLVGDEEWPTYATTAYAALQRAGIDVKAARGYRAYYEQQKKDKPGWVGPKLADDQTYVVLIGPNPPPS